MRLCSLKQPLPSNQRQQTLFNLSEVLILSDIVFIVQIATIITPISAPSLPPPAAAQHYLHKVSFVSTSWEKLYILINRDQFPSLRAWAAQSGVSNFIFHVSDTSDRTMPSLSYIWPCTPLRSRQPDRRHGSSDWGKMPLPAALEGLSPISSSSSWATARRCRPDSKSG